MGRTVKSRGISVQYEPSTGEEKEGVCSPQNDTLSEAPGICVVSHFVDEVIPFFASRVPVNVDA